MTRRPLPGPSASASSSAASAAHVRVDVPRRRPRRPSVPDQVRRDASPTSGRCRVARRLPAPAVPGQAVDRKDLRAVGSGRSGARAAGSVTARCCQPAATAACRTPVVSFLHARTTTALTPDRAHRTGHAGYRSRARRRGHRQEQSLLVGRDGPHRCGHRSGIGSAADGFGAAQQSGPRGDHGRRCWSAADRTWCANRWSAPCTRMRSRCCGWPRSATAIRRRG